MRHTGGALGAAVAADVQGTGEQLKASVRPSGAVDPVSGDRWTWGALMIKLNHAMSDYRAARDNFAAVGDEVGAADAQKWLDAVMNVRDYLAELYREWPDLGIDEQGRLSGFPVPLIGIAGIIAGSAIWWWAVSQAAAAANMLIASQRAISICEDNPGSPECAAAQAESGQASQAYAEGGINVGGAGFGAAGLAVGAFIAYKVLG